MIPVLDSPPARLHDPREAQTASMVGYLRDIMLTDPIQRERFHAIFLDSRRAYITDAAMGAGRSAFLKLRMRDLFGKALSVGAQGLIIAHNHPSGDCRPSEIDIKATHRLNEIGQALDIELLDHLIITETALYSMRAGGHL
uniref:JAB domain-containing protein n=1 Tax=uncultured Erythrobacter sp. TaxID=263913 RepID=UPI00261CDEE7|nr:JAB domain-containing protein [uncultured Erythrobacter sp.]